MLRVKLRHDKTETGHMTRVTDFPWNEQSKIRNDNFSFVFSGRDWPLDVKLRGTILDQDLSTLASEEDDVTANVELFSIKAICIFRNYLFVETLNFATVYWNSIDCCRGRPGQTEETEYEHLWDEAKLPFVCCVRVSFAILGFELCFLWTFYIWSCLYNLYRELLKWDCLQKDRQFGTLYYLYHCSVKSENQIVLVIVH